MEHEKYAQCKFYVFVATDETADAASCWIIAAFIWAVMAGAASQAGDADSSRAPGLTSGLQGSVNVHHGTLLLVPQWQCISSFVFNYIRKERTENLNAYQTLSK